MAHQIFSDPKLRSVYIVTKLVVFAVAALATWPIARIVGPKAWMGLGVFAVILTVMAVVVLAAGAGRIARDTESQAVEDDGEETDPEAIVEIPIEDSLDLHPFTPAEVQNVVGSYLEAAYEKRLTEVRLIHGRGIGVQRERVQSLLARHPLVSGFHDAPPDRGGWGATVAYLKKK